MSDLIGRIVYCNKKAEIITGYRITELIGKHLFDTNLLSEGYKAKAKKLMDLNIAGKVGGPDEFE